MRKIFLFVSVVAITSIIFGCNKQKTPQELLKEEKKAISRFIDDNDFYITDNPDEMYEPNVYFKTKEGLYINVIKPGNGNKVQNNQEVFVRYEYLIDFKRDTARIAGNESGDHDADVFRYKSPPYPNNYEGWAIGLRLVSQDARVNLIVPSALQPTVAQGNFLPVFYGNLIYRFY